MSGNKELEADKQLENIEASVNKWEQYAEKNQKPILVGAISVLAIVAVIILVNLYYVQPRKVDAQREIFNAQYYFEADSFNLALNGDGQSAGFLEVIEEYGSTPAGNLANYYAGVCYLKLGDFESAKKHLKAFSSDDETLNTFAAGLIGDAESELGNMSDAISAYKKAANMGNKIASPIFMMKLGAAYETEGKAKEAKEAYQQVKDEYPNSIQASYAEKYLNSVAE